MTTLIKTFEGKTYNLGIFENETRKDKYILDNSNSIDSKEVIIKSGVVTKYLGSSEVVSVPDGARELSPCLFWDNQNIKEVRLPDSLISISGDTFYNCSNLEGVNIPANCKFMGNNPFAGCPKIKVTNESSYFNLVNGVLYNKDFTRLIYYPISNTNEKYVIDSRCKILGKHSFYLCNNLKEVEIPKSVIKLENNPFSGCNQITLNNKSPYYHMEDSVIYDRDYSSVIGCLNSIDTDCLVLKDVKRICRNKDSTVLDFFAGSGTTGHAVIDLNKEDAGNRKYILISNSESNICKDVTLKRIKMFDSNVKFIN